MFSSTAARLSAATRCSPRTLVSAASQRVGLSQSSSLSLRCVRGFHGRSGDSTFRSGSTDFGFGKKLAIAASIATIAGVTAFGSPLQAAEPPAVETVSEIVGEVNDLKDGEMKQVVVNGIKILLARVDGKFYATDLNCTHFGAPLNTGVLSGDRVVCPWHNAVFNVKTGNLEDDGGPATNRLNTYSVTVDSNQKLVITVPKDPPPKRTPGGRACRCSDKRTFVIIGGGAAGAIAAETLRQDGFKGQLVLVTKESNLPYDRTSITKGFGTPVEKVLLRSEDFYKTNGIQVHREREVKELNTKDKVITFQDGSTLPYDSVLLASGAVPRVLPVPGGELENILTVRTIEDGARIADLNKNAKKVVIVGTSFIGMEAASALKLANKELDITVVGFESVPFERVLGKEVGGALQAIHQASGVKFRTGRSVKEFLGDGVVQKVKLDDGEELDADFVVLGVGVAPNTSFAKDLPKQPNGAIVVDNHMQANDGVFAAGDIATFPYRGQNIRVEHWAVAQNQGRIAAHNMLGKNIPFQAIPFFWTRSFNLSLQYVGYASSFDEVIVKGNPAEKKFQAFYVQNGKVVALAAMGSPAAAAAATELLRLDKFPSPAELKKAETVNLPAILKSIQQD